MYKIFLYTIFWLQTHFYVLYIYLYSKLLCLILNSLQKSVSVLTFDLSQSTARPTDPVSGQIGRQGFFVREENFSKESLWSFDHQERTCTWDCGVGYSGVIVTLCEVIVVRKPSGEGWDVELGARTSEKFSVFAFGLLALISYFTFITLITCSLHSLLYSLVSYSYYQSYTHTTRLQYASQTLI